MWCFCSDWLSLSYYPLGMSSISYYPLSMSSLSNYPLGRSSLSYYPLEMSSLSYYPLVMCLPSSTTHALGMSSLSYYPLGMSPELISIVSSMALWLHTISFSRSVSFLWAFALKTPLHSLYQCFPTCQVCRESDRGVPRPNVGNRNFSMRSINEVLNCRRKRLIL